MSVPGWRSLGPGCGRDDWTVVGEEGREAEKKGEDGKWLQLMIYN